MNKLVGCLFCYSASMLVAYVIVAILFGGMAVFVAAAIAWL